MKNREQVLEALIEALDQLSGKRPETASEEPMDTAMASSEEEIPMEASAEEPSMEAEEPVEEEVEEESAEFSKPAAPQVDIKDLMARMGRRAPPGETIELGTRGAAVKSKK